MVCVPSILLPLPSRMGGDRARAAKSVTPLRSVSPLSPRSISCFFFKIFFFKKLVMLFSNEFCLYYVS